MSGDIKDGNWERNLIEKLATASIVEQRRKRRWGIFFKLITVFYIGAVLFMASGIPNSGSVAVDRHVALVNLTGTIASDTQASAERINRGLKAAFDSESAVAVVLKINSPGGSPVQSGLIYDEIGRLRKLHPEKPLYVVVEEMCASGGYYVAAAADKIFVDKASMVGSIGVLINGFGFVDVMNKLGVERRLITAGENKGFLDPFSPESEKQIDYAKQMVGRIHEQFIDAVKRGRGERLKETPDMFSGLVWTGDQSIELGLADELGSVGSVARDVVKVDSILDYSDEDTFAERFAKRVGVMFGLGLGATVSQPGWINFR